MSVLLSEPSFWSAIAAGGSMLCSFFIYRIHRINLLEAARPELEPEGWSRSPLPNDREVVRIAAIRNLGKGVARRGMMSAQSKIAGAVGSPPILMASLPANAVHTGAEFYIDWTMVPPNHRGLELTVTTHVFDAMSRRHDTTHTITVMRAPGAIRPLLDSAPGLLVNHVTRVATSQWRLRVRRKWSVSYNRLLDLTWRRHQIKGGESTAGDIGLAVFVVGCLAVASWAFTRLLR